MQIFSILNYTTTSTSISEHLSRAYQTYSSSPSSSSRSHPDAVNSFLTNALYYAYYTSTILASYTPHLYSFLRAITSLVQTADAVTILCGLVALFVVVRVVDYVKRMIMFWVRLAIRIVFVVVMIQVVVYYWHVGLGELARDAGKAWGFINDVFEPNGPPQGWTPGPGSAGGWGTKKRRAGATMRGRGRGRWP